MGDLSDINLSDGLFLADEAATTRLGLRLAEVLGGGDTLLLVGQIGAGKSHLARALIQATARRIGAPIPDVPSPTYTLVQSYTLGPLDIVHADLYRLGDTSELAELGLEDAFGSSLCLIEWPDRLGDAAPPDAIRITLQPQGQGRHAAFETSTEDQARRLTAALRTGDAA